MKHKHSHLLQKTGTFLTVLCAIHCLAMPFLITALPFLGDYFSETAEHILVVVSLILATLVLVKDYRSHHQTAPLLLFGVGALLQVIAILGVFNFETQLLLAGSVFIVVAYYVNWRWHQKIFHEH